MPDGVTCSSRASAVKVHSGPTRSAVWRATGNPEHCCGASGAKVAMTAIEPVAVTDARVWR